MKHWHHIVPKHAGGSDDPSNLVHLTVEEHAEAHKKLWEQYGRWQDKIAWQTLSGQIGVQEIRKKIMTEHNPMFREEVKEKFRGKNNWMNSEQGKLFLKYNHPMKGKKHSEESLLKNSINNSKNWKIISPKGEEFVIKNLLKFCKENHLEQAAMWRVSVGKQKHHKKWKCYSYVSKSN